MSFTFDFTAALQLSQVRMLIPDTTAPGIFSDDEINQFLFMESSQALYASGQSAPTAMYQSNYVPQVYSIRRSAAMALDVLASRLSRQAAIESLLDVKQGCAAAAAQCRASATALREQEENLGSFAIAEMVNDAFSSRQRMYAQMLRIECS